jgi:hypothetical protein
LSLRKLANEPMLLAEMRQALLATSSSSLLLLLLFFPPSYLLSLFVLAHDSCVMVRAGQAWLDALYGHLNEMESDGLLDTIPTLEIAALSNLRENTSKFGSAPNHQFRSQVSSGGTSAGVPAQKFGKSLKRSFTYVDRRPQRLEDSDNHFLHRLLHHKSLFEEMSDRRMHTAQHDLERISSSSGCPIGFAPEARDNFFRSYTPGMPGFTLQTVPNGHNSGRLFIFSTDSQEQCAEAMGQIAAAMSASERQRASTVRVDRLQSGAKRVVESGLVRGSVGAAILVTWCLSILESQLLLASESDLKRGLQTLDVILTFFFLAELLVNMVAFWFERFWSDGWLVFDFIIGARVRVEG